MHKLPITDRDQSDCFICRDRILLNGCKKRYQFLSLKHKSHFLKWYYDQKIISFFSSDFQGVFA